MITAFTAANVIEGNLTLGQMLAIQFIIGLLNSPVEQFVQFLNSFQDTKFALERINDVHNKEEEKSNSNLIKSLGEPEDITISNLSFKYDIYSSNYILNNLSLKIPKGKVTAVVGSSGSGKTTLLKLLLGFYSNYEGDISIGKNKLEEYDIAKWREQCGIVMQDGFIFSESIARNIAVDDNEINLERLEYAAKLSNSFDFISALPLKFNTKIGKDGIGLSLGQKQRLLIARAIYKQPKFVFLDEATNSLDAVNEKMIMNNLEQFYEGKTVLVIAHRLSTVRWANQIIVLENGHIAEIGNHAELTAMKGVYYNLVKNQLELG